MNLFQNHGVGVGLRPPFYSQFLDPPTRPRAVKWVEVISENFMRGKTLPNSRPIKILEKIRENYPIALHGVSLNIGSMNDLDLDYLRELKKLVDRIQPIVVSDHLCWTKIHGIQTHDLNPLPYTESLVDHVVGKINRVQDFLGRRILIENVSSYLTFEASVMREEEFIREVSERSDSGILLDINNVFVSSVNHGFDAKRFLRAIPRSRVGQIHLAGHTVGEDQFLIDTHDHPVRDEVWELYRWYGTEFGHASSMIERDGNIPEWKELEKEVLKMQELFEEKEKSISQAIASQKNESSFTLSQWKKTQEEWADSLLFDYSMSGIKNQPPLNAEERFDVYENAYWSRFDDAITEDFPLLKARIESESPGDESSWRGLIYQCFQNSVPKSCAHSWTMNELGEVFVENLRDLRHPYLQLAESEWAKIKARLSSLENFPPKIEMNFLKLSDLSPDQVGRVTLVLHPSTQLLEPSHSVVWFDTELRDLRFSPEEWGALQDLRDSVRIVEIAQKYPEFQQRVPELVQKGLICGFQIN